MSKNRKRIVLGLAVYVFFVGLILMLTPHKADPTSPVNPPVIMEVLDPSLMPFAPAWQTEIGRRFPHAVGILCHGGYFLEGQWIVSGTSYGHLVTAQEAVWHVQQQYPDRTIVLLACNTDHLKLNLPGVYYAHSSVWCVPDRAVDGSMLDRLTIDQAKGGVIVNPDADDIVGPQKSRWETDPEVVGNVFEFSTDN